MPPPPLSPALRQFVDDELVRAPMIFDQAVDGVADHVRREMPTMSSFQRQAAGEMMQAAQAHRARLSTRFVESLREQVEAELARRPLPAALPKSPKAAVLALVEEDAVALDVELSHTIQLIKSAAEQELRELRTFIAALVGDMDVAEDHNPFRPEAHARALWAAAQALPLSRGHQVAFMRHAGGPLAQVLRQAYAASCTRLENMGVEPATYRTVITPGGTRRSRTGTETTFSPDLQRMRETMPAPMESRFGEMAYEGQIRPGPLQDSWREVARGTANRADRQSVELISRLFQAILADDRLPDDVRTLLERLHAPAMRLTLRDPSVLDKDEHPLWRFMQVFSYEAEMAPDVADPERVRLLRLGQMLVDKLAAEPEQRVSIYRASLQRLEEFLRQRLERRCAQVASQIGALQKFEASLGDGTTVPGALDGVLDERAITTVPAELMPTNTAEFDGGDGARQAAAEWLSKLRPGQWVRMLIQGRWVRAQLLHVGAKREAWLFGDGASDATWAVRRGALLQMHAGGLAKTLKMRSLVGSAAARVQEQVSALGLA